MTEFITSIFYNAFYQHLGKNRTYHPTSFLAFDTSGIELYVTENNPKTLHALIKRPKAYYKDRLDIVPHKMAYSLMPSQAVSCPDAKQLYINGHFWYADKFAIFTNGLDIV